MLTVADPEEAVAYFQRSSAQEPGRIDFSVGLARSLVRVQATAKARCLWARCVGPVREGTHEDRVDMPPLVRAGDWDTG